jgi:hypothetical protein
VRGGVQTSKRQSNCQKRCTLDSVDLMVQNNCYEVGCNCLIVLLVVVALWLFQRLVTGTCVPKLDNLTPAPLLVRFPQDLIKTLFMSLI